MEEYQIRTSSEIIWCALDDRFILVNKKFGEIIGLNFMQGDEYNCFLSNYSESDPDLTRFYHAVGELLHGQSELDRINQAMWAWSRYKNNF